MKLKMLFTLPGGVTGHAVPSMGLALAQQAATQPRSYQVVDLEHRSAALLPSPRR